MRNRHDGHLALTVAGFPRSGTTWLCRLLSDALSAPVRLGSRDLYYGERGGKYLIHRTHAANKVAGNGIVYITRDPRDVLVSLWHYRHKRPASLGVFIDSQLDRYAAHVSNWQGAFSTSYEALSVEPVTELRRVVDALTGIVLDDTKLGLAVERQRKSDWIRKGVVGGWRDEPVEREAITASDRLAELVEQLGYAIQENR